MIDPVLRKHWRIGRLQLRLIVWRHVHSTLPDRWVFQPSVVYDRRRK